MLNIIFTAPIKLEPVLLVFPCVPAAGCFQSLGRICSPSISIFPFIEKLWLSSLNGKINMSCCTVAVTNRTNCYCRIFCLTWVFTRTFCQYHCCRVYHFGRSYSQSLVHLCPCGRFLHYVPSALWELAHLWFWVGTRSRVCSLVRIIDWKTLVFIRPCLIGLFSPSLITAFVSALAMLSVVLIQLILPISIVSYPSQAATLSIIILRSMVFDKFSISLKR